MLVKIILLFLVGMAVLALVGRMRWPGALGKPPAPKGLGKPRLCPRCNRFLIGKADCDCKPSTRG